MGMLIVVSPKHHLPAPLLYNLGTHSLVITNEYGTPNAFDLCSNKEGEQEPVVLDNEETYRLYQYLHTLLFQTVCNDPGSNL